MPSPVSDSEIKDKIRQFLLAKHLKDPEAASLRDDTRLQSSGLLDSLEMTTVVIFAEKEFGVEFNALELTIDHFDSIEAIAALVAQKRK